MKSKFNKNKSSKLVVIKLPNSIDSTYKFQIILTEYKKGIVITYLGFEDKIIINRGLQFLLEVAKNSEV